MCAGAGVEVADGMKREILTFVNHIKGVQLDNGISRQEPSGNN